MTDTSSKSAAALVKARRRMRFAPDGAPLKAVTPHIVHIVPDALTKQMEEERLLAEMELVDALRKANNALDESSGNERREPPWMAEFLCAFARAKDIDALMGDFAELFARDCLAGMSQRRAVVRYWVRVLHSIGPQMSQAIRRVGVLGLLAAALRR